MLDSVEPTPWWRLRRTWLIAGAGAVVAATATVALVAQSSGAACAAAAATTGQATYYAADGGGNCSFDQVSNPLVVALGNAEYKAGAACGGYLDVKGPKGTVRVKVTDRCPECPAGHIDLSKQAFAKIGDVSAGVIKVTYTPVTSASVPGPMSVRVKEGSSRYWLALRLDNVGNPTSTVELQQSGAWKALTHTEYNYWIAQNGAGPGPFTVRVTDSAGRRTTLTGVTLTPGTVQRPGATGGGTVAPKTTAASPKPAASSAAPPSTAPSTLVADSPAAESPATDTPSAAFAGSRC